MSDNLVKLMWRLALTAETADYWTDGKRLMPAAGVADIVGQAASRIEEMQDQLAKAADALFVTDRWLEEMDMYESPDYHFAPGLQMVREALNELTGGKDGC